MLDGPVRAIPVASINMLPPMFDGITVPQREWPSGYAIRVTRYADAMLRDAFPEHWADVLHVLTTFRVEAAVDIGGPVGNRSPLVKRFDGLLEARGWGKQRIELTTAIREVGRSGQSTRSARNHETDMFKRGAPEPFLVWPWRWSGITKIHPSIGI